MWCVSHLLMLQTLKSSWRQRVRWSCQSDDVDATNVVWRLLETTHKSFFWIEIAFIVCCPQREILTSVEGKWLVYPKSHTVRVFCHNQTRENQWDSKLRFVSCLHPKMQPNKLYILIVFTHKHIVLHQIINILWMDALFWKWIHKKFIIFNQVLSD